MGFNVFNDSEAATGFVLAVLAMPICCLATGLRFVSTKRAGKKIGMEDWFALLALVTFLIYTSIDLWSECAAVLMRLFVCLLVPIRHADPIFFQSLSL